MAQLIEHMEGPAPHDVLINLPQPCWPTLNRSSPGLCGLPGQGKTNEFQSFLSSDVRITHWNFTHLSWARLITSTVDAMASKGLSKRVIIFCRRFLVMGHTLLRLSNSALWCSPGGEANRKGLRLPWLAFLVPFWLLS